MKRNFHPHIRKYKDINSWLICDIVGASGQLAVYGMARAVTAVPSKHVAKVYTSLK